MRRIAYLINLYPAVSHTFIRREIHALERRGIQIDRIALSGWDSDLVDEDDLSERAKTRYTQRDGILAICRDAFRVASKRPGPFLKALRIALSMSRKSVRPLPYHLIYLAQACRVLRWVEETGATHIHAHFGTNPAEIACLVRCLGGPEYSFTNHGRNELDGAPRLHFPTKVKHAKFSVAVSHYCRSQILRELSQHDWNKLHVVHCGLDADYFLDGPADLPDAPRFLCVGRMSPEKGHALLLEAFQAVHAKFPEARLVLAGDGELRAGIQNDIMQRGLGRVVEITGWIDADRVQTELARATVLVQPSLIEGLPVVIMEAMARKRPVIATYVSGIPELVKDTETGWLVPAGDVAALTEALTTAVTTDKATLTAMGEAGQVRARERHLIDTEAEKIADLIFDAASEPA
jgi:glycosyltransferase involved in cell wall biosynthesis